jgi:hypothetical protein
MIRFALLAMVLGVGCGGDDSEADEFGVGAQCAVSDDCFQDLGAQVCLPFKGGYCGIQGCTNDADCLEDSACVAHTDGTNYCFRVCLDKAECNANRDAENEANCSSSVTFTDGTMGRKACVPPS